MPPRKQTEVFASGAHIKWSVLWVKPKKASYEIVRKEYGTDLSEAMRVYALAIRAGKKLPTLRSNNVAFPPPERYLPHTRKRVVKKPGTKKVRRGGKLVVVATTRKVLETYNVIPMERVNLKGFYWCPYCREMRKFQIQQGFPIGEKSFVEAKGMYCPLCGVSHRDFSVRKYNPAAARQYFSETQPTTRRTKSTASSTSRRTQTRRNSRRTS
jgi:hypothetical protein